MAQQHSFDGSRHALTIAGSVPGTPHVLRRVNQIQVLSAIRRQGPVSRPRLAAVTGLSKVTVDAVVKDLLEADLVVEETAAAVAGKPGRPGPRPRLIRFRDDNRFVVGIDIGASKGIILVSDLSGRTLAENRVITQGSGSRDELLDTVRTAAHEAIAEAGISPANIVAIGVGTPGIIDPYTHTIDLAPQLPQWHGFAPADELRLVDGVPVIVANEVDLAVLGEEWKGAGQGIEHAAYLHIGVGVGLGMVVDGVLAQGAHGAAGEVGYLPIGPDDPDRPPATGKFEWTVGGPSYVRRANKLIKSGRGAGIQLLAADRPVDAQIVFQAAAAGDAEAQDIVDELTRWTAEGLAAVISVLDPGTVIIGGGVSRAGEQLLEPIRRHVATLVPHDTHFTTSQLGDEAVAMGAVRVAIERWEADLFVVTS